MNTADSQNGNSIVEIHRELVALSDNVTVSGEDLALSEVIAVARRGAKVQFTDDPAVVQRISACYERMMEDIRQGVPVYGLNTGYVEKIPRFANGKTAYTELRQMCQQK